MVEKLITDKVTGVAFYPIKSCRAATIDGKVPNRLDVGPTGFEARGVRDRDWLLLDNRAHTFVSQRGGRRNGKVGAHEEDTRLATVHVDVRRDHVSVFSSRAGHLELPLRPTHGKPRKVNVFGRMLSVVDESKDGARYFSNLLGRDIRLVRTDRRTTRELPDEYRREQAFNQVAGADGFPFLLTSEKSLGAICASMNVRQRDLPINRYRGNVIISGEGLGPFGEDYIDPTERFMIGPVGMWVVKACARCTIPNIDQLTGENKGNGLKVLAARAGRPKVNGVADPTRRRRLFFGQNLVHAKFSGDRSIGVGDPVIVDHMNRQPNVQFGRGL